MEQAFNPYLPLDVYIPDGEPHVFDGRVYIYGSCDDPTGKVYCPGHYNVWSAPVDNLADWRDEGTSYLRWQDPSNEKDRMQLWAPDVTKGPDGKYYLYYCFSFFPEIGVAVSDRPAGPFRFLGHVKYPDSLGGRPLHEFMPFDPAVLTDEDGKVYLYFGFAPACEKEMTAPKFSEEEIENAPEAQRDIMRVLSTIKFGENAMVVELEQDMMTMRETPHTLIPGGHHSMGTDFEGHAFFEASSIRKINGRYYFVYSSSKSHELCYAISNNPTMGFQFGGTIISNGDVGMHDRKKPVYTLGNNHGGIVQIKDKYYIFYHRQTAGSEYSRQGCAEEIKILPNGSIPQVEITSCGLNGGPLLAQGSYPAAIACHMTCPTTMDHIDYTDPVCQRQTRIVEQHHQQFITDIQNGTRIGYKYFDYQVMNIHEVLIEIAGKFKGKAQLFVQEAGEPIAAAPIVVNSDVWKLVAIPGERLQGKGALFFSFEGEGRLKMRSFAFQ